MPQQVSWSERNMANAVYAVENNILSVYSASKIYSIPKCTLKEYIKLYKNKKYKLEDNAEAYEKQVQIEKYDEEDEIKVEAIDTNTSWFNIQASWYCHACKMDKMIDMRQCSKCCRWYHEICVGLTPDDLEPFVCPIGC